MRNRKFIWCGHTTDPDSLSSVVSQFLPYLSEGGKYCMPNASEEEELFPICVRMSSV